MSKQFTIFWNENPEPNLAGYRLRWGTDGKEYANVLDVGKVTACTLEDLDPSHTYYFSVSAYTKSGLESVPSAPLIRLGSKSPTMRHASPGEAHRVRLTGTFIDQPVIFQGENGGHRGLFHPRGTIEQTMTDTIGDASWGPRYLHASVTTLLPLGKDWVTRASTFRAEFSHDGKHYRLFNPVVSGKPLFYGAEPITEADGYTIKRSETALDVFFEGYPVGHADEATTIH